MSYFNEIEEFATYSGEQADFHFSYNANSGGGQAFLAGKYFDSNEDLVSPQTLEGKIAIFKFSYFSASGEAISISLDDIKAKYEIKPRGNGSTSMKLSIGNTCIAPSKVISSFMMLPPTCGVKNPANLNVSILSSQNYWLQSMWLKCNTNVEDSNEVELIPIDLVFGGGTSKDTSEKECRYFYLNANKRFNDIINLSNTEDLFSTEIYQTLKLFSDIYQGNTKFSYEESSKAINRLMIQLALEYPSYYSGITDPLPVLVDIAKNKHIEKESNKNIYHTSFARNRILFGAPGTGKSFTLNRDKELLLGEDNETDYERVTFHPDYSYANFVGTYKPVPFIDSDGKDSITYEYVPGPFMRTYVKALKSSKTTRPKPFLLIVEEINRSNVAAVFGEVFQLLDRDDSETSEYPIQASEDIKKHLVDKLGGNLEDYEKIKIPDNMFIWATMNSADQGVFPMDTAFKRRWDFTYLGIDDSEDKIVGKTVELGKGENSRIIEWNELRKAINDELLSYKVNEDKLLGPYFLSKKIIPENDSIDSAKFIDTFKSKVIMYLFDDAAKQKRQTLFDGCNDKTKYSSICKEFEDKGVFIFNKNISNKFLNTATPPSEGVTE